MIMENKIKRLLFLLGCGLMFSLSLSLTSCGDDDDEGGGNSDENPPIEIITVNGVSFTMVRVEGGSFQMGASDAEPDEKPLHNVKLSDYYIGQTEVTQDLWQVVMGHNPSHFIEDKRPVETVSWNDCQAFIAKLNLLTGKNFRLPTEAEWEYAARGGKKSKGYMYAGSNNVDDVAWHEGNSGEETHLVAHKQANELGLYDMSGNVWEWCQDWYDADYYSSSPSSNPCNTATSSSRVGRGGSWYGYAASNRVAYRGSFSSGGAYYYIGLRLAR
ncbi:MAG: formylglycine-generating enzyme family protein [Prevotella sp.]|nr:formylglycine-generating enzyme family protein [Prevotella sp.]